MAKAAKAGPTAPKRDLIERVASHYWDHRRDAFYLIINLGDGWHLYRMGDAMSVKRYSDGNVGLMPANVRKVGVFPTEQAAIDRIEKGDGEDGK